jgi:hypothetical protein
MARTDALSLLRSEFILWHVNFCHEDTRSGHIKLRWQVAPEKPVRSYIIAKTGSDHREWLNARADIRRLFRADGLSLREVLKSKPGALRKALELPPRFETESDQLRMLRCEVAELTELVIELSNIIIDDRSMTHRWHHVFDTALSEQKTPSIRSIKAIDFVSDDWNSTEAIAHEMKLSVPVAYRKLFYLRQKGLVELARGRWRKRPSLTTAANIGLPVQP